MRVLQVTCLVSQSISSGGVEVVVRNLSHALKSQTREVSIFALAAQDDFPQDLPTETNHLFLSKRLHNSKSWSAFSIKAFFLTPRVVSSYDTIHIHLSKDFFTPWVLLVAQIMKKNIVIQTHGMIYPSSQMFTKLFNFFLKLIAGKQCKFIYLTENEKERLEDVGFRGLMTQINNPVLDLSFEAYLDSKRNHTILFLSRFHERKRPLEFVNAAKLILQDFPWVRFIMAGPDDGILTQTKELISNLKLDEFIELPGSIPRADISLTFSKTRIFVLPSYGEIFPMSVLEAVQHKVPVIMGQDCPLGSKLKAVDGIINADNAIEIYRGVKLILENPILELNLIKKSHAWVKSNCSSQSVAKSLTEFYKLLY
jgi:glycosyltransferase involved in cell wall biosynthesis